MIKIFGKTDKTFNSNGDYVVRPLKAKVHKEDNSSYYLDLEVGLEYVEAICEGNIVIANTPQGEQPFRISNPQKTKTKISTRAWHVFYDLKNYMCVDETNEDLSVHVVLKDGDFAINELNDHSTPISPFSVSSNISSEETLYIVRKSLYEAFMLMVERWKGHLVRDGFNVSVQSHIGEDKGVTVRYRKNLKDISCQENWEDVVTKILPVGRDGILLNAVDSSASVWIISATQYDIPYVKTVSFEQNDINEENYPSEQAYKEALVNDLREKATAYIAENCLPKVNYTIRANINAVIDIGDVIEVIDERLGEDLLTNVISYDYDCLLNKYTEIEFGNFRKTLQTLMPSITSNVDSAVTDKVNAATDPIKETLNGSYVIMDGDNILIVDTLPKASATNVIRIDKNGIAFSSTGINGTYKMAWSIGNVLDFQNITVSHFLATLISGGVLTIGGTNNTSIEIRNSGGTLIGTIDKNGLTLNDCDISKNVLTRFLPNDLTNLTVQSFTTIPFSGDNSVGGKLSIVSGGGVEIRAGVSKIMISAFVDIEETATSGDRTIQIIKNSTTIATASRAITPRLIDVSEGDLIQLQYYVQDVGDIVKAGSALTVEVVK